MKVIHWLDKYFEEGLSAVLLAAMSVVILLQIILKWFHMPLSWSEEMARYMFIWLIYIASSYAVKKRSHIKVEILSLLVKEKGNFKMYNQNYCKDQKHEFQAATLIDSPIDFRCK